MDTKKVTELFCGVCHKWKVCVGRMVRKEWGMVAGTVTVEVPVCADCMRGK
jgi:hypothetical protein